ncbi:Cold shock protein, CspA family [Spirosoma fluviale]|uniref:Cold shock protein, CspA family n=1 Tax=Spirosoma fluviale TaxID=1597977 RepID=A0A286GVD7_9BACT|nr:Cold shock protein, CspA family [Spirosoma fluviale]
MHIQEDSAVSIINELYRLLSGARRRVENNIPIDDDLSADEKELLADIIESIHLDTVRDKYKLDSLTRELNDTFDQVTGFGNKSVRKAQDFPKHASALQTGTVKFFNESKGFGFIKSDSSGDDIFVHVSALIDQIHENDKVRFTIEQGKKGLNAVNIKLL